MSLAIEWTKVLDTLRNKDGEKLDLNSIDMATAGMDREMGFGFITDTKGQEDARVVLQGPNPFLDNFYGLTNPDLGEHLPYSQIYNVKNNTTDGNSFLFLRHYFHLQSFSEQEIQSIKVASCEASGTNFNGIFSKSIIMGDTPVQSNIIENQKSMSRQQSSKLLGQMQSVVGSQKIAGTEETSGYVVITIHKALDIEKKGMVGKADPYVVLQYNDQKPLKSRTVDNNYNPVWHFTGHFKLCENEEENVIISVYDDDIGKDDFLGQYSLSPKEIRSVGEMTNKTVNLEKCKSGQLVISCKYIPLEDINKKIGQLSLIVHGAQKLEKKNKLKKADPYAVCTLGDVVAKSPTINGNSNPKWEFKSEFDVFAVSPRQLSVEVFDDDIGKDSPIGNVTLDLQAIMNSNEVERTVKLENCKSGSVIFSAFFVSGSREDDDKPVVEVTTTTTSTTVSTSHKRSETMDSPKITLLEPVFIDKDFIVIRKNDNACWFMVVSPERTLPIEMNIVPFKKNSQENFGIYFKCLPASGFHHVKAVVHSGKGLRKCGYERPCVLNRGQRYQLLAQDSKETVNMGDFVPETWGPDTSELSLTRSDPGQQIVNLIIQREEDGQVVIENSINLYSGIEAA